MRLCRFRLKLTMTPRVAPADRKKQKKAVKSREVQKTADSSCLYCLNLHLADFYCLWLPSSGLRTAGCELRRRQAPPPEAEVEIGEADVSGADANDAEEDDAEGIGQFVHGAGII